MLTGATLSAATRVGIMRDGSSLDAVELPPLSADVHRERPVGSRTRSRAYASPSWLSRVHFSSAVAQLHARHLSWLSCMHTASTAGSAACAPSQLAQWQARRLS